MSGLIHSRTLSALAAGTALLLGFISPRAVLADESQVSCDALREALGASYTISSNGRQDVSLDFWRAGNQVMYHYPDRDVADQWTRTRNGYLKPVRYFTADERAIEYDAFDINGGKGSKDWESRSRWISQDRLDSMQLMGSEGEGCLRTETYEVTPTDRMGKPLPFSKTSLTWLPELQLVERYLVRSTDSLGQRRITQWRMDELKTDKALVQRSLQAFDDFAATDYADVGDNESDPFLMKMIRLGFVQHGASGFYNADGSPLSGGHVH
ncbi:hypothetical protein ACUNV4_15405 [Granulosicoccus sp. 3-233]|uniref:hypothetical protein n=1 Tax=Granulosicoccus sp. 3-233 TaxID=3417969 RepID=UPI003D33892A